MRAARSPDKGLAAPSLPMQAPRMIILGLSTAPRAVPCPDASTSSAGERARIFKTNLNDLPSPRQRILPRADHVLHELLGIRARGHLLDERKAFNARYPVA